MNPARLRPVRASRKSRPLTLPVIGGSNEVRPRTKASYGSDVLTGPVGRYNLTQNERRSSHQQTKPKAATSTAA